jgi:hypothetical protein
MDPLILNGIMAVEMAVTKQNSVLKDLNRMSEKRSKLKPVKGLNADSNAKNPENDSVGEFEGLVKTARTKLDSGKREWLLDAAAWAIVPFSVVQILMIFTYLLTLALASSLGSNFLAAFGLFVFY